MQDHSKKWPCGLAMLALFICLQINSTAATADALALAQDTEIAQIRRDMEALKTQYEDRIKALEQRLTAAEANADEAKQAATSAARQAAAAVPVVAAAPVNPPSSANALNPAISLILAGTYAELSRDPAKYTVPGFALPTDAGPGPRGFSTGESELNVSANIDDKFYGSLTAPILIEDGKSKIDLEEAYFQTLALPYGLTFKGGRFFSRIGYLNEQHAHADEFVDRPLVYQVFLNNQFDDTGVQLRWLAPSDRFIELGSELYRGDGYPAGGADRRGKGVYTVFAHVGDDLGTDFSYRIGASYLSGEAKARDTGNTPDIFDGDSNMLLTDLVLKWAPNGNPVATNVKLQAEYLHRWEDGLFNGANYYGAQDGFYVQGVYQFMPRWRVGVRYDGLYADNRGLGVRATVLDDAGHDPNRQSLMLEYDNSEFSRFRLQYNHDHAGLAGDDQILVNYLFSLGAHGAHIF